MSTRSRSKRLETEVRNVDGFLVLALGVFIALVAVARLVA
jgi:hypothetical protein